MLLMNSACSVGKRRIPGHFDRLMPAADLFQFRGTRFLAFALPDSSLGLEHCHRILTAIGSRPRLRRVCAGRVRREVLFGGILRNQQQSWCVFASEILDFIPPMEYEGSWLGMSNTQMSLGTDGQSWMKANRITLSRQSDCWQRTDLDCSSPILQG